MTMRQGQKPTPSRHIVELEILLYSTNAQNNGKKKSRAV